MNEYNIDSQKLVYYSDRLNHFMLNGDCFPVYLELELTGSGNQDIYNYNSALNQKLDTAVATNFIDEISECGVKYLVYTGEGEPLTHPDFEKIALFSKKKDILTGVFTDGILLNRDLAKTILPLLTFIHFSFNSGLKENYASVSKTTNDAFTVALKNISNAVEIKRSLKLDINIGVKFMLLEDNLQHLIKAVKIYKKIGVDCFVIKPFCQQNDRLKRRINRQVEFSEISDIIGRAQSYMDKEFSVINCLKVFQKKEKRNYLNCFGPSFVSVVNSKGDMASCRPHWHNPKHIFGNIYENSFKDIWAGEKRKRIKKYLEKGSRLGICPPNCLPDSINEFLYELINPSARHTNFI